MDKYNLEHPVLFSTKVPHGGNNRRAKTHRTIVSIGATNRKYEEVIHRLPTEWFKQHRMRLCQILKYHNMTLLRFLLMT